MCVVTLRYCQHRLRSSSSHSKQQSSCVQHPRKCVRVCNRCVPLWSELCPCLLSGGCCLLLTGQRAVAVSRVSCQGLSWAVLCLAPSDSCWHHRCV
jgi:hypothetical protein